MKLPVSIALRLIIMTLFFALCVTLWGQDGAVSGSSVSVADKALAAPAESPNQQNWLIHTQGTEIIQGQPGFHSPYTGPNSISPRDTLRQTSSFDLFLGAHIWPGGAIYFNPEYYQGFGFADAHGIAAFPNGEAYKVGKKYGDVFIPHLYYQQTIGFGGEQEDIPGDLLQLADKVDISRLTITIGRLSVGDSFDNNAYSHDPTTQFMNWALIDAGAFDYAADSLGYIEGATLDLNQKRWAIRYGIFDVARVSNGEAKDGHYLEAWQQMLEAEGRFSFWNHPGKVRVLGWLESAHMGSYSETLANPQYMNDITKTERYRLQYGAVLNIEQEITSSVGAFMRASWRDGHSEVWQFTDIDHSISVGLQLKGTAWKRNDDVFGLADVISGLTEVHRDFLAAGGLGITIGDGKLPHYEPEDVLEMYYDMQVVKGIHMAIDYQLVVNPAYNPDRGPINIISGRIHFQF